MPRVLVDGVGKSYSRNKKAPVVALEDVSFTVPEGEFLCILGPSGCGKSTLLRMLAGLLPLTHGRVSLENTDASAGEQTALMFQSSVLLPWYSICANVMLPARIRGWDAAKARTRARELIDLVGLAGFADRYPNELSGGMQQRVALARALILDPWLLLMDEPFGALDALTRQLMTSELERIWQDGKKTVVLITHDINEAVTLADRVLLMTPRPGRILREVPIDLPRPRDRLVRATPAYSGYVSELQEALGVH